MTQQEQGKQLACHHWFEERGSVHVCVKCGADTDNATHAQGWNDQQRHLQVAQTILEQLGGKRFIAMTGAKDFVALNDWQGKPTRGGLQFSLPNNFAKDGINKIRVTLTTMDDYLVEPFKIRGAKVQAFPIRTEVYGDNLQAVISKITGLDTYL